MSNQACSDKTRPTCTLFFACLSLMSVYFLETFLVVWVWRTLPPTKSWKKPSVLKAWTRPHTSCSVCNTRGMLHFRASTTRIHTKVWLPCGSPIPRTLQLSTDSCKKPKQNCSHPSVFLFLKSQWHRRVRECPTICYSRCIGPLNASQALSLPLTPTFCPQFCKTNSMKGKHKRHCCSNWTENAQPHKVLWPIHSHMRALFSQQEIQDQLELQLFHCKMAHKKQMAFE